MGRAVASSLSCEVHGNHALSKETFKGPGPLPENPLQWAVPGVLHWESECVLYRQPVFKKCFVVYSPELRYLFVLALDL